MIKEIIKFIAVMLGYTCIAPLLGWALAVQGLKVPPLPTLDGSLWELLFGMLGLGTLRTIEKARGVATEALRPLTRGR